MENLLPQGLKNIIIIAVAAAAAILCAVLFNPSALSDEEINRTVLKSLGTSETRLEKKNRNCQQRADSIYREYLAKNLAHTRLTPKEALIVEQDGVIKRYFGEIYYFKFLPMKVGAWALIEKNQDIYFTRKMANHVFYISYYGNLEDYSILNPGQYPYAVCELKYSRIPLLALENKYIYDHINDLFFYYHLINHSNGQFILHLKFSRKDFEDYRRKRATVSWFMVMGIFLVVGIIYYYEKKPILSRLLWLLLLAGGMVFLSLVKGEGNLYLPLNVPGLRLSFYSLYQVLILLLFLLSVLYFSRERFKNMIVSYLCFNVALVATALVSEGIFKRVQFNYLNFSRDHLELVGVIFLLHLLPLLFIAAGVSRFDDRFKTTKQKISGGAMFIMVQALVLLAVHFQFAVPTGNMILLSVIAFVWLFSRRSFLARMVVIFLLAISIYHLTAGHSLREKHEFIENSLKNIFLNQGNYAKFIAREIVHEINSSISRSDFYEFFQENNSVKLESIWRKTIASRENIASGIFVVSKTDEVLSYFSYQIPFFKVETRNMFPFWAMEDTTAEVHGREIPLAVAYISIFKEWERLGRIIVLVYNSPELLLRYQDKINIFTIDSKIDGRDFSYIKLNAANQIVENPSNINLENIMGILRYNNQWITFTAMEVTFKGYIFRHSGNTFIIFFPANTFFKNLSEVIKIFLMLSLLALLFYVRELKRIDWRSVYYSFSIRVFAILILISFLTAIVFSVIFINFSTQSSEQKVMRMVYESGRTAQNIAYNLIKDSGEISKDFLFSMSDILNGDVSVYKKSGLVDTSNYRKIINSQIPLNLDSRILSALNEKNQKFVLVEGDKNFYLFYKVYDYIFMVELSNKWEKALSEERYYTDFIITMFFILIIIGFSAAFFSRNKILSPIDGLNRGMAEVEKGNLPKLDKLPAEIEIKSLYMGFNAMIEGIREQKRAISEMSRMKTIIRLGRRVAHEVKNPLTPIKLSAEQILKALKDKNPNYEEIIKQSVNYIIDETDHLKKVSYGFLDLSRLDEINAEEFNLVELVQEELFNVRQIYAHIDFSFSVSPAAEGVKTVINVTLDKIKIKQVLKNLLTNSIEAIGEKKGEIGIYLEKEQDRDQGVIIKVEDNGVGMDEREFARAFEVDYSTKEIGTGLGLFIVKRIIELHKGHIEIQSEKNKGTWVIIHLPERVERAEG